MILAITIRSAATILLLWFKTDVVTTYGKLLALFNYAHIKEFEDKKSQEPYTLYYPTFLNLKYFNFFTKLISCPLCLGFWISFVCCLIISNIYMFPIIYISSLIVYGTIVKLLNL